MAGEAATNGGYPLWELALSRTNIHRFSTLFTAQDVRDHLATDAAIDQAIDWCKQTGITHVYLEAYRDGYRAERPMLLRAKARFQAQGFLVSGCVTTTKIGKPSTGWGVEVSCYTDEPTQEQLQSIFEYAAGMFDQIIIDDFYFTDCTCAQCMAGWQSRTVRVGDKTYPIESGTAEAYRCELMLRMGEDRILAATRRVNPKVKIILKFPQWYDDFQNRGYDVSRETAAFDGIWAGTETRDYNDERWGGAAPYEGYFVMRWLGGIGGEKCGGGWYDYLGTSPATYIEQARQTILGGARESFLFHYGALQPEGREDVVAGFQSPTGPADILALRQNLPELLAVADKVRGRSILGVAAYKPPSSHPGTESRVYDFLGMLGVPLAPCHEFPTNAPAAFFPVQSLKDPNFIPELTAYIKTGRPTLLTDGLANGLRDYLDKSSTNVRVLVVGGKPDQMLDFTEAEAERLRQPLLVPWQTTFQAPNHVGLYLFDHGGWVVENFNGQPVEVTLNGETFMVDARGWKYKL
jgi:hypothetical protein